jgi:hypothetical protein
MPRTKWRTVSCTDDSLRSHSSQPAAYLWVSQRLSGARFRVQVDEGYGWENYATVVSTGTPGRTEEE